VVAGAIAVIVVAIAVGAILYSTQKNKIQLSGSLLRVRTHAVSPENTVLLADIRVTNPSDQQFIVRDVQVFIDDMEGEPFSETDAQRLFDYYPVLGQKYNPNLKVRQKISPGESIDRMVTVSFKATDEQIEKRKAIRIVITDVDRVKTEIVEKRS
jgi:hypothetical protein